MLRFIADAVTAEALQYPPFMNVSSAIVCAAGALVSAGGSFLFAAEVIEKMAAYQRRRDEQSKRDLQEAVDALGRPIVGFGLASVSLAVLSYSTSSAALRQLGLA